MRAAGAGIGLLIVMLVYMPAGFGDLGRVWAAAAMLVVGFVAGEALTELRMQVGVPGIVPSGLLAVLLAMYLCVPETDQFAVAALVPVTVLVLELVRREQLGVEWYALAAVSVAWAGMFGSSGRQSALIGAIFAWWPILLPWVISRSTGVCSRYSMLASMVIGAAAALIFARTGGISDSTSRAILVAVLVAFVSSLGAWLVSRRSAQGPSAVA